MRQAWAVSAAAALLMAPAPAGGQGGEPPLTVGTLRFYSPARATTTIEGVCELRLAAVASEPDSAVERYRVEVSVRDSTGLELQRSSWGREVPGAIARARGATAVETFDFAAAAGRYRVLVRAIPQRGPSVEQAVEVSAYRARPSLSDVLLGDSAWVGPDSGALEAGEVRRGSLVMRTAPVPHLSPTGAKLSYYAEVYPWPGASPEGELTVTVVAAGGRSVTTASRAVRFDPAGGATEGFLDLTGLPVGEYRLQLRVRLGDSTLVGDAPFAMTEARVPALGEAPPAASAASPFATASEAQLDSMYAPLVYLLEGREHGVYEYLTVSGKRRFLEQFWARQDSTHGSGVNRAMVRFYAAVNFANQTFGEGGAGRVTGWRTDRGRVFLRNGRWDEILRRPAASPLPYEVWKYTRGRQRYYLFLDRSGLGNYQLIATNDRNEVGLQNWGQMFGTDDSLDVARFVGSAIQGGSQ